ncbi:lung carbonyl reductase protein [Rutstroemia sp. NJR-2017a WRK4]|nr:lung carbonyl reductase protein [Rutstroemia sp. NJR-2017a WRK4]
MPPRKPPLSTSSPTMRPRKPPSLSISPSHSPSPKPPILYAHFENFYLLQDFVGMDMARKFIQMAMTRAKRYANYRGGRKYVKVEGVEGEDGEGRSGIKGEDDGNVKQDVKQKDKRLQIEKSEGHEGKEEKEEASRIFREKWEMCKRHEGYRELREVYLKEKREWEASHKDEVIVKKEEEEDGVSTKTRPRKRRKVDKDA